MKWFNFAMQGACMFTLTNCDKITYQDRHLSELSKQHTQPHPTYVIAANLKVWIPLINFLLNVLMIANPCG